MYMGKKQWRCLMENNKTDYSFSECKFCKKLTGLKKGLCTKCNQEDKVEIPDIFKSLFNLDKGGNNEV